MRRVHNLITNDSRVNAIGDIDNFLICIIIINRVWLTMSDFDLVGLSAVELKSIGSYRFRRDFRVDR